AHRRPKHRSRGQPRMTPWVSGVWSRSCAPARATPTTLRPREYPTSPILRSLSISDGLAAFQTSDAAKTRAARDIAIRSEALGCFIGETFIGTSAARDSDEP